MRSSDKFAKRGRKLVKIDKFNVGSSQSSNEPWTVGLVLWLDDGKHPNYDSSTFRLEGTPEEMIKVGRALVEMGERHLPENNGVQFTHKHGWITSLVNPKVCWECKQAARTQATRRRPWR